MAAAPVRGTQSLVGVMQRVWKHPSLTGIELGWRWLAGAVLLWGAWKHVVLADDSLGAGFVPGAVFSFLRGLLYHPHPLLIVGTLVAWSLVSAAGRTVLLRRLGARRAGFGPVALWTLVRVSVFSALVVAWLGMLVRIGRDVPWSPDAFTSSQNLVGKFAEATVITLVLFVGWSLLSWSFWLPLVRSAEDGFGVKAVRSRGREMVSKFIEVNFVMGIIKVALLVLAMVFSACPLPFQSVSTPGFLRNWWMAVGVLYLLGSDIFHVVRVASYLELYRTLKSPEAATTPGGETASHPG